jgi:hypothetical protein
MAMGIGKKLFGRAFIPALIEDEEIVALTYEVLECLHI